MGRSLLLSWLILAIGACASAEIYVVRPDGLGDYTTIQAAIDASQGGDIIELTDGSFSGIGNREISFRGKAITLRSQNGDPNACIIDCEGSGTYNRRGFLFDSGEGPDSRLEAVQITNGYGQ